MTNVKKVTVLVFPAQHTVGPLGLVDREFSAVGREGRIGESCCFVFETLDEVVSEQVREREPEISSFDAVFADPDSVEERLVEGSSDLVGGPGVCLQAVGGEGQRLVEVSFDLVESQGAGVEDSLGLGFFFGDPCLFFSQEVDGDGVGVVSVEQFAAFVAELFEATLLASDFFGVESPSDLDVIGHVVTDLVDTTRIEGDDPVVVGDLVLDLVDGEVALGTAAAALPSETEGVLVGASVASGVGDTEA